MDGQNPHGEAGRTTVKFYDLHIDDLPVVALGDAVEPIGDRGDVRQVGCDDRVEVPERGLVLFRPDQLAGIGYYASIKTRSGPLKGSRPPSPPER